MSNIIENAKNITIIPHAIHFPKLHGHMKLELTGCREKQVIEHDNMMTDIFDKMFSFASGIWAQSTNLLEALSPSIQVALGGIVLTDKTLEETALTVPGGTEVTACAAYGVANNDSALTQGSYNSTESTWDSTNKKMTYVYDWTTNQGNGTIAAAALTHANTGRCGFGDAGLGYQSSRVDSSTTTQYININNEYGLYADDTYIVSGNVSNNKLEIFRRYADITKVNPIFTKSLDNTYSKIQKTEIQTDDLTTASCCCVDSRCVYMTNYDEVFSGNTFKVYKLSDPAGDSPQIETITITNNSGYVIEKSAGICVYNGYIYTRGRKYVSGNYNYAIIEIEIENSANQTAYEIGNPIKLNKKNIDAGKIYTVYNNNILVFDTVTKTRKYTKTTLSRSDARSIRSGITEIAAYSNSTIYKYINYEYLATINNLESSVVKTADKTMKATYTIQE